MKKLRFFAIIAAMMTLVSCGSKEKEPLKILVLYYSQTGNTEIVANEIAQRLHADVERIEAVNPYDGDFRQTIERCMQEREEGILPDIHLYFYK